MRKVINHFVLIVTIVLTSVPQTAQAQLGCLFCGAVGFALGSALASDQAQQNASVGGEVLYRAPMLVDRLQDPLEIRFASVYAEYSMDVSRNSISRTKGESLKEVFSQLVPNSDRYTVVEILRYIHPQATTAATLWFGYIETEKLKPLPQTQSKK